jgi:hypothetical protein
VYFHLYHEHSSAHSKRKLQALEHCKAKIVVT